MTMLDDVALRPLREDDLEMVLEWRNSDRIREAMYTDHIIGWDEHLAWYHAAASDPRHECLVSEYKGKPVGFVSFTEINKRNETCFWTFYIGATDAIKGLGSVMEIHAIDKMIDHHGMRKISCEVLASRTYVIAMHKKFGFVEEGVFRQHVRKGDTFDDVVRLALFSDRWPAIRASRVERFVEAAS